MKISMERWTAIREAMAHHDEAPGIFRRQPVSERNASATPEEMSAGLDALQRALVALGEVEEDEPELDYLELPPRLRPLPQALFYDAPQTPEHFRAVFEQWSTRFSAEQAFEGHPEVTWAGIFAAFVREYLGGLASDITTRCPRIGPGGAQIPFIERAPELVLLLPDGARASFIGLYWTLLQDDGLELANEIYHHPDSGRVTRSTLRATSRPGGHARLFAPPAKPPRCRWRPLSRRGPWPMASLHERLSEARWAAIQDVMTTREKEQARLTPGRGEWLGGDLRELEACLDIAERGLRQLGPPAEDEPRVDSALLEGLLEDPSVLFATSPPSPETARRIFQGWSERFPAGAVADAPPGASWAGIFMSYVREQHGRWIVRSLEGQMSALANDARGAFERVAPRLRALVFMVPDAVRGDFATLYLCRAGDDRLDCARAFYHHPESGLHTRECIEVFMPYEERASILVPPPGPPRDVWAGAAPVR